MPLRRLAADWVIPVGLACMVVAFAAGSGFQPWVKRLAHDVRWTVLMIVCVAALLDAIRRLFATRSLPPRGLLRFGVLAGSFLVVAAVSTAWSVSPRLTFERAGSLAILFLLAAALASSTAHDVAARVRLFQGLAAGAVVVGVLGLLVLIFDSDLAALRGPDTWRYRGFTENPNTIAILAAAALPLVFGLALRPITRGRRAAWIAGGLLLVASIIASESRGGLLAVCAGTLLVAAFGVEGLRNRVAAVTALMLVFGGGIALREAASPAPAQFSSNVAPAPTPPRTTKPAPRTKPVEPPPPTPRSILPLVGATSELPREVDEIGHPALSKQSTTTVASGRLAAWKGALELIGDRPILGYGFGTEQQVFVDRWYFFQGGATENSYLGLLLQLGTVGLALIVAIGLALLAGGIAAVRVLRGDERLLVLMGLGVLVAAAVIMLIQSYLYSVGNVATATVWISLFALAPVALEPRTAAQRVRAPAPEGVA
jgi:O-antigen ligase